jgi:hypothetical protein
MKKPNEDPIQPPVSNTTSSSQATNEYIHGQSEEAIIRLRQADEDRIESEEAERGPSFQQLEAKQLRLEANRLQLEAKQQRREANQLRREAKQQRLEADQLRREANQLQLEANRLQLEAKEAKEAKETKMMSLALEREKEVAILTQELKLNEEYKKILAKIREDLEPIKNQEAGLAELARRRKDLEPIEKQLALLEAARQKAKAILSGQQPAPASSPTAILTQQKLTTHNGASNSGATPGSPKANNITKDTAPMNPTIKGKPA